jgi:predicted site-specific integrase-resolvase
MSDEKCKKYVGGKEACQILGVHSQTLYNWDRKGWIETIRTDGNKRLYNVEKYLKEKECKGDKNCIENLEELDKKKGRLKICYVRVSSMGQKDDLERQKKLIREKYPKHMMIEEIGSGINLNKRGIRKIIELGIEGRISELVVAYKDRLARYGYELIEHIIEKYSKGEIIIVNKKDDFEPEEELAYDVLQIMNVFVEKMNGLRKYKKKEKEAKDMEKKVETKKKL